MEAVIGDQADSEEQKPMGSPLKQRIAHGQLHLVFCHREAEWKLG